MPLHDRWSFVARFSCTSRHCKQRSRFYSFQTRRLELARLWVHSLFAKNEIRRDKITFTKQSSMVIQKHSRKGRIFSARIITREQWFDAFTNIELAASTYDLFLAQRNRFKHFKTKDLGLTAILVLYDVIFFCLRRCCLFSCGTPFCGTGFEKSETKWNVGLLL